MPQDLSALIERLRTRNNSSIGFGIGPVCDEAAAALESQAAEIARLTAERDALKQTMYEELEANLRIRALGNARSDEDMTTFLKRLIAERDALQESARK